MTDTERANLVNDIAMLLDLQVAVIGPHIFKYRYGRMYCTVCGLDAAYCNVGGHTPDTGVPSADNGAAASLQSRINECKDAK